ncbi:MAG TPA: hypothetical protein VM580_26365, partial [Labilithrix sp.]|nr:hypothetical protein [Labilithrix sp.]
MTYELDYRSEALVDGALERSSFQENAPRMDSVLGISSGFAGTLVTSVVEHRSDGSARVLVSLRDLDVTILLSGRAVSLPDSTFASLERGFFVEYGAAGDVRGISVEDEAPPVAARFASQIIAFLQLEAPSGHGASWETDEKDSLGDLHARYSVLEDAPSRVGGQLIQKLTTRSIAPRSSGALGRLLETGGADQSGTLAYEVLPQRGIVVDVAGALTTEQRIGDLRVGSDDSTIQLHLTREDESDVVALRALVDERTRNVGKLRPIDPGELRARERRSDHEALLARIDLVAVVADARAHPPPPQSREAATYARLLSAAVDVSSDARGFLEKTMLDPAIEERAFLPLARAFGEDGSPAAQAALGRVIAGRRSSDPGREVALFSLGRVEAPTDATIALLESISLAKDEPCAFPALLALGRAAGQLEAIDRRRGTPVLERLLARTRAASDDRVRVTMLEAIGNAGSPLTEPELARFSGADVSASVRRAAVSGYRLVPTTTARDALVRFLVQDADPAVRG